MADQKMDPRSAGEGARPASWRRAAVAALGLVLGLIVSGLAASPAAATGRQVGEAVPVVGATLAQRPAATLSLRTSQDVVRKNEAVWLTGKARAGSRALAQRVVSIQLRPARGGKFRTQAKTVTRANGGFTVRVRVERAMDVRVVVQRSSRNERAISKPVSIATTKDAVTLSGRQAALGARAGATTSRTKSLSAKKRAATRVKKVRSVKYRAVAKGMLVEVRTASATRTWLVTGKTLRAYRAAGGPAGRLGVPITDANCGLREGGCVQRFSRGTIYELPARSKAAVTTARGAKGEVIAAGLTQLGYAKRAPTPAVQNTKFNRWMGSSRPWCSLYVSWAFTAGGHHELVPQSASYARFRASVRKNLPTGSKPRVGALAFMDTRSPRGDNHVGIVIKSSKGKVTVLEGNMGAGPGRRGVITRTIPAKSVIFYAYPEY